MERSFSLDKKKKKSSRGIVYGPSETPATAESDIGAQTQTSSSAITKTFTQQLLQLNGSRFFISKHKADRE